MTLLRPAFTWEEVRRRLDAVGRAMEAAAHPPPEAIRRVLEDRAERLAQPAEDGALPQTRELLVFTLAGARYGIDPAHAREVMPLRGLVPVPCTPTQVLGVVNHRGRALPVLDLGPVLDLPGVGPLQERQVVVVEAAGMVFGLVADAVTGMERRSAGEIGRPPPARGTQHPAFIQAATPDMVAILDLEVLMQDPRMLVDEEVALRPGSEQP